MVRNLYALEIQRFILCLLGGVGDMLSSAETHQGPRAAVLIKDSHGLNSFELEEIPWQCEKCGISSAFERNSNKAHHRLYFLQSTFQLTNLHPNKKKCDFLFTPCAAGSVHSWLFRLKGINRVVPCGTHLFGKP